MATATTKNLRQRQYDIFIKPYIEYQNGVLQPKGAVKTSAPCGGGETTMQGGDPWMLYKTTTSFPVVREIARELMLELGYVPEVDFRVEEHLPMDFIVTPLA